MSHTLFILHFFITRSCLGTHQNGMIECDNIAEFARCLAKFPPGTRHLEEKMLMARNRQSISESLNLVDVHYNLGNDLYEYVLTAQTVNESLAFFCRC